MKREDGPFVTRLSRAPGEREARYAHLFSGEPVIVHTETQEAAPAEAGADQSLIERVATLEAQVSDLKAELESLKRNLGS
jgi:uncharacterized protein YceH (UPF0502 family)